MFVSRSRQNRWTIPFAVQIVHWVCVGRQFLASDGKRSVMESFRYESMDWRQNHWISFSVWLVCFCTLMVLYTCMASAHELEEHSCYGVVSLFAASRSLYYLSDSSMLSAIILCQSVSGAFHLYPSQSPSNGLSFRHICVSHGSCLVNTFVGSLDISKMLWLEVNAWARRTWCICLCVYACLWHLVLWNDCPRPKRCRTSFAKKNRDGAIM